MQELWFLDILYWIFSRKDERVSYFLEFRRKVKAIHYSQIQEYTTSPLNPKLQWNKKNIFFQPDYTLSSFQMSMSKSQGPSLADVEDQIARVTLSTVNTTKSIFAQVEEKSSTLKTHHQMIASNFFDTTAKDLTQQTNLTIQNLDQMIEQTIHEINEEMDTFEKGVSEGFDGFVTQAIENLQEIQKSVNAENDDSAITKLTVKAADTIEMLLKDTEQMYMFYSRYLTTVLENKLQNTTDRMSKLLHSQRRFVAAKNIDRINLCYNVCTQNTKTSRLLKSIMESMSVIGQTTDVINGLKSIHLTKSDEHAQLVSNAKSSLADTMESGRLALDQLLKDDFCYLGSAVRKMVLQRHGSFKQALLKNLTSTVESLSTKWNSLSTNFQVIRSDQRLRMAKDFLNSVQNMMDAINAKARRHGENEELERLMAVQSSLMQRFDEMTSKVNSVFETSQNYTSESLHNYLRFTVDRQLSNLPTLSMQNFIPDDICPLAINYQAYISFTLNAAMGKSVPDIVDALFTLGETADEGFESEEDGLAEPAEDNAGTLMIIALDDGETDSSEESADNTLVAHLSDAGSFAADSDEIKFIENFMDENLAPLANDLPKSTITGGHEMEKSDTEATKSNRFIEEERKAR